MLESGSALPDEEIPTNSAGQGSSAGQASAGQEYADSALPDEEITHDEPIISQVTKLHQDKDCNYIIFQILAMFIFCRCPCLWTTLVGPCSPS